jgi:hypothetical protein
LFDKTSKLFFYICSVAALIFLFSGIGLLSFSGNKEHPNKPRYFEEIPLVINCDDSPYDLDELNDALSFWEDLGYEFLDVVDDFNCGEELAYGAITITSLEEEFISSDLNQIVYGSTRTFFNEDKILYARITIVFKEERVLEHELGHALGWEHFDIRGHIMNPNLDDGGWKNFGLESNYFAFNHLL